MTSMLLTRVDPETARRAIALGALRVQNRQKAATSRTRSWEPFEYQKPPDTDWDVWMLLGGRGSGKTAAGSRAVDAHAKGPACLKGNVPHRIAIVSTTHDDAVETCVRGETGLLSANPDIKFRPGAQLNSDLTWQNGAVAQLFGTFAPEDVERFRGPQHCYIWGDEFASWRKLDESFDMLEFGLRLGPHPRWILTSTPKPRKRLLAVMREPTTAVSTAKTSDNIHLPAERRDQLYRRYGGTMLGRQELEAEIIVDVPGALWRREALEVMRRAEAPVLTRIVVAIDPSVTSSEDSDEAGIVVAGIDVHGTGWVLGDYSLRASPIVWARRAVEAFHMHKADRIIAETNNGGEMVGQTIRTIENVPFKAVTASRGKVTRAEPISALYEQGRVHHVGSLESLEDQMCQWVPGDKSPDRMDALVWALTELMIPSDNPWAGLTSAGGVA